MIEARYSWPILVCVAFIGFLAGMMVMEHVIISFPADAREPVTLSGTVLDRVVAVRPNRKFTYIVTLISEGSHGFTELISVTQEVFRELSLGAICEFRGTGEVYDEVGCSSRGGAGEGE